MMRGVQTISWKKRENRAWNKRSSRKLGQVHSRG